MENLLMVSKIKPLMSSTPPINPFLLIFPKPLNRMSILLSLPQEMPLKTDLGAEWTHLKELDVFIGWPILSKKMQINLLPLKV